MGEIPCGCNSTSTFKIIIPAPPKKPVLSLIIAPQPCKEHMVFKLYRVHCTKGGIKELFRPGFSKT